MAPEHATGTRVRPYVVYVLNPAPGEKRTHTFSTTEKQEEMAHFLRRGGYDVQLWDNRRGDNDV